MDDDKTESKDLDSTETVGPASVARRPTLGYRAEKFARRNKAALGAIIGIIAVLLIGIVASSLMFLRARTAEQAANKEAYAAKITAAELSMTSSRLKDARRFLESCPRELRNWEWGHLSFKANSSVATLDGYAASFGADDNRIVTMDNDNLYYWDKGTFKLSRTSPIRNPHDTNGGFMSLAVNPDGSRVLWSSPSLTILTDLDGQETIATWKDKELTRSRVGFNHFSHDGSVVIVRNSESAGVFLLDTISGKTLGSATAGHPFWPIIAFSDDDKHLVLVNRLARPGQSEIISFEIDSGKQRTTEVAIDAALGEGIALSPDGRLVALASMDKKILMLDLASTKMVRSWSVDDARVVVLAFAPNGRQLASGSFDGVVRIWDTTSGAELSTFWGSDTSITTLQFSRNGKIVLAGSYDGQTRLWWSDGGGIGRIIRFPRHAVEATLVSPDGRSLFCVLFPQGFQRTDAGISIVDIASGAVRSTLELGFLERVGTRGHNFHHVERGSGILSTASMVSLSADGSEIARGLANGTVRVWNIASQEVVANLVAHEDFVTAVAFSPDSRWIASASRDHTVRIWDWPSGNLMRTLDDHSKAILALDFSPTGRYLATGDIGGKVILWDVGSLEVNTTFELSDNMISNLRFSPDGKLLVAGVRSPSRVVVWEIPSGKIRGELEGSDFAITSIVFTPDGTRIATASADSTIRIWNTENLETMLVLEDHERSVNALTFTADGRRLVSGSSDGTVRIWDTREEVGQ